MGQLSAHDGDEQRHGSTEENQLGTDGENFHQTLVEPDDLVKIEDIVKRFVEHPTARMMAPRTRRSYSAAFRRFARTVDLKSFTRRQLADPKGKRAILEYATTIPERSIAPHFAALCKVWTLSLNLPWPVDVDRDIGRLPRVRRREAPPTEKVKLWAERLQNETDPYLRALWQNVAQSGQRLSTVAKLDWRHVRYGEDGQPCEIRANGFDEGFKTGAILAWWLPPDVRQALVELRSHLGSPRDDSALFPWFNGWGQFTPTEKTQGKTSRKLDRADADMLRRWWERIEKKYGLPHLTPGDLRHWVAKSAHDVHLREEARAYMQGHEQPIANMGDVYDHRSIEENLLQQARKLPQGSLGMFTKLDIEIAEAVPQDVMKALVDYHDNKVGYTALFEIIDKWRLEIKVEIQK